MEAEILLSSIVDIDGCHAVMTIEVLMDFDDALVMTLKNEKMGCACRRCRSRKAVVSHIDG